MVVVGSKYDEYLYKIDNGEVKPIVDKGHKDRVMSNQSHIDWRNNPSNDVELEFAELEAKTAASEFIKGLSGQPGFKARVLRQLANDVLEAFPKRSTEDMT